MRRAGLCGIDVSVRPSVRHSQYCIKTETASVMISSLCIDHVAPWFHSLVRYGSSKNSQGVTPSEGDLWDWGGFERVIFAIFWPISRRISETVQDTTKVTIEH